MDRTLNTTRSWPRPASWLCSHMRRARGRAGRRSCCSPTSSSLTSLACGSPSALRWGSCFLGLRGRERALRSAPHQHPNASATPPMGGSPPLGGYVAALVDGFVYRAAPTATPAWARRYRSSAATCVAGRGACPLAVVPALEMRRARAVEPRQATAWYRFQWKTDWLWWVAGGTARPR